MKIKVEQPEQIIIDSEEEHLFNCFCTFIMLYKGEKINIVNIFLNLLKNKCERNLFKQLLSIETDFDVVKCFIKYAPHINTSKYITKRINKGNFYTK